MEDNTFLIVGLGNPGKNYIGTRHNVGYGVIDILAEKYSINMKKEKFKIFLRSNKYVWEEVYLSKTSYLYEFVRRSSYRCGKLF